MGRSRPSRRLAVSLLVIGVTAMQACSPSVAERCGATREGNRVVREISLVRARDIGRHLPSLAAASDLQRDESATVLIFEDPYIPGPVGHGIPRPSGWTMSGVVCVVVATDPPSVTVFDSVEDI